MDEEPVVLRSSSVTAQAWSRSALTRITRRARFRRTLPPEFGAARFYATTEGGLKYLRPDLRAIDPMLTGFALQNVTPGASVWDIGANVGLFTFSAAGLAGPGGSVLAVEPDLWLAHTLRRSARLNSGRAADVTVLPVGIADTCSTRVFHIAATNRAANYLEGKGSTVTGGSRETQVIATLTLDTLLESFPAPDVMKIDIEGGELEALQGARQLLTESRPRILVEVLHNRTEVSQLLHDAGYRLYDADSAGSPPVDSAVCNTLAIPR